VAYNDALLARISQATSMLASPVGGFTPRRRADTTALFTVSVPPDLDTLAGHLSFDERSLADETALMTPGHLQLNFLSRRALLTSVVFIYPDFLRWPELPFDARLVNGRGLAAWLVAQGWQLPEMP